MCESGHISTVKKLSYIFKKCPQLPGAKRTRAWHYHGSDTPTSPRAIYVLKSANGPNIFWGSVYQKMSLKSRNMKFLVTLVLT